MSARCHRRALNRHSAATERLNEEQTTPSTTVRVTGGGRRGPMGGEGMRLCTKTASPSATATKGLTGSPHTRVDRSVGDRIAEPKLEANSTQMCRRHGNRSSGQSVHGQKDGALEDISNLHATEAGTRYTSVKGHHCYFTCLVPQALKTKDPLGFICLN